MAQNQNHNHSDNNTSINAKKLLYASMLNIVITTVEIAGGILSNSVALLSDALHNFSDAIAIVLAYSTHKLSKRSPTKEQTFGLKRIEIVAALVNGIVLVIICIFLFYEAYKRLVKPEPVDGAMMVVIAAVGLIANFLGMALMKKDAGKNLNVKAAYLHLMGDTLSSIAVLGGGVCIYFYHIYWIDPVVTFVIGLYIIKESWDIIKQAFLIIMQATPQNLDLAKVKMKLESIEEIENVHHVHAWNLNDTQIHFECHIDLKHDHLISETDKLVYQIKDLLRDEFNIVHTTIQFEFNSCQDKSMIS